MTAPLQVGASADRWPALLLMREADDSLSMLTRLVVHGQQVLGRLGVGAYLQPPFGDPVTTGSSAAVGRLQALEASLGQGPGSLTCDESRSVTTEHDAARFPRWLAAASAAGMSSSLSVPMLFTSGSSHGSLTLYSGELSVDLVADKLRLEALAAHAVVGVANLATYTLAVVAAAELQAGMAASSIVEQAKGVLVARERISPALAGEYLLRTSTLTGRSVRDLAAEMVSKAAAGTLR